jgi:hypothetical protein
MSYSSSNIRKIAANIRKNYDEVLDRILENIKSIVQDQNSKQGKQNHGVYLNDEQPHLPASDEQLTHVITVVFENGVESEENGEVFFSPFTDIHPDTLVKVLEALVLEIENTNGDPELQKQY